MPEQKSIKETYILYQPKIVEKGKENKKATKLNKGKNTYLLRICGLYKE